MSKYVFREKAGRLVFVGDFDGLYVNDADPWGQSGGNGPLASYYRASRERLCDAIRRHTPRQCRGIEIGCGNGWLLKRIQERHAGHWDGMDISPTAIAEAKKRNPRVQCYVGDIAGEFPMPPNSLARYDVVILSQILWYVLARIDQAVGNAGRLARVGGIVVVTQAFLSGPQRYGVRIADGWRGAVSLFLKRYPNLELIEARYDDSDEHAHHDGLMVFRKIAHAE